MLNLDLTKEDLEEMERMIAKKELSQSEAARRVGIASSVMNRWIRSSKPLWDRYKNLAQKYGQHGCGDMTATNPEGITKTFPEHARELEITTLSFRRRMRKFGEDDPRTWTKGKLRKAGSTHVASQANWEGLTNRSREHNLKKIPSPSEYERRLWDGNL